MRASQIRAPILCNEVARDLKKRVADKENPNREAELVAGDGQIAGPS